MQFLTCTRPKRIGLSILLALVFMFALLPIKAFASNPYGPFPTVYYVSKNGDNSDGKSWKTAWNEMDQIPWQQINVGWGDSLVVDGGEKSMVYRTPMRVQALHTGPWYRLRVNVSTEAGHNGRVIIYGGGKEGPGLSIGGSYIEFSGRKARGVTVCGWRGNGVVVSGGNQTYVNYVESCYNSGNGLHMPGGFNISVSRFIIHDNRGANVLVDPQSIMMSTISNSWIYNSSYRINSDGIVMGNGETIPQVFVGNCVIGPGLRRGFHSNTEEHGSSVTNCLFINATRSNISTIKGLRVSKCTSFMTRRNPWGRSHACIKIKDKLPQPPVESITNSIFYGGQVRVRPDIQYSVSNNFQYKTTGNTTFLASEKTDPMFETNLRRYRNRVSIRKLINTDFALKPDSPAKGSGSTITSVSQLFGSL